MLASTFSIAQIVFAILLIAVVLLQQKGSGLGAAFGGAGAVYTTRRGVDRVLFRLTIVIAALFFLVSLASVLF